ncbi:retrovirus-related pol polyprotein from transposon opus, partial [Trifolium medium]|nr:retrovirus-related pol polyprotein from transposon opus [Trifolium medium]
MSRNTSAAPVNPVDELARQLAVITTRLDQISLRMDEQQSSASNASSVPPPEQPFRHRLKLDIPRFDGTDAHGWIFKITQFFSYHHTPEEERITIASFYLDGAALSWYQWMYRNGQIVSWTHFLHALETRFAPTAYDDPRGA